MPAEENPPATSARCEHHAAQSGQLHRESPLSGMGGRFARHRAIASPQVVIQLLVAAEAARVDEILLPPVEGPHLGVRYRLAQIPADIAEESGSFRMTRHENEHAPRAAGAHFE